MNSFIAISAMLSFISMVPSVESQRGGTCSTVGGEYVGNSGHRTEKQVILGTDVIIFQRKGSDGCACSYAQNSCKISDAEDNPFIISGKTCDEVIINGTKAVENGIAEYPKIKVDYEIKICNYNDYDGASVLGYGYDNRSFLKFWYTEPVKIKIPLKDYYTGNELDVVYTPGDEGILEGQCNKKSGTAFLETTHSKYYMQASIQGPLQTPDIDRNEFCHAYSFLPIDFIYDYGDDGCKFETTLSCIVDPSEDGAEEFPSCEEYIDNTMVDPEDVRNFTATYFWKTCNLNQRDVFIQQGMSNSGYNTYQYKENSVKFKRQKEQLPPKIPGLASGENNCYEPTPVTRRIDPTKANFFQINVQGRLYNNDGNNLLYFRDKECKSYEFKRIPLKSAPIEPETGFNCNLIITELGAPADAPDAIFVELYSENCRGKKVGDYVRLVSGIDRYNRNLQDSSIEEINLNDQVVGGDGFLVLCTESAYREYGDGSCDFKIDSLDRNIGTKDTAIVKRSKPDIITDIYGSSSGEKVDVYGLLCVNQTFSRSTRDKSYSSPSGVWQPQGWTVVPEGVANVADMGIRKWKETPLHLIFSELLYPIDSEHNRFIELFSANKRNYEIKENVILVRTPTDGGPQFTLNLNGKRINGKGMLVLCMDNSDRFKKGGIWAGKCDYPLDHTIESVVVNMMMTDRFELRRDESAFVLGRSLQRTSPTPTPCPYNDATANGQPNSGKKGRLYDTQCSKTHPQGRRRLNTCDTALSNPPNTYTLTFVPNASSDEADPNDSSTPPIACEGKGKGRGRGCDKNWERKHIRHRRKMKSAR